MSKTMLKQWFRGAIGMAMVALAPGVVRAEQADASNAVREPPGVPDHAQAEARSGGATTVPRAEIRPGVPDHAQAQDRGAAATTVPLDEAGSGSPDHAQAEARSVVEPSSR